MFGNFTTPRTSKTPPRIYIKGWRQPIEVRTTSFDEDDLVNARLGRQDERQMILSGVNQQLAYKGLESVAESDIDWHGSFVPSAV